MQRHIADRGRVGALIAEGDMLQPDIPGKRKGFLPRRFGHDGGIHHLPDAPRRHFGVRVHHQGEGRHEDTVHHQRNILDDRKDIAAAYRAEAGLHPVSSKIEDRNYDEVHQGDGDGGNQPHLDIGFYDVLRHHPGSLGYAVLLLPLAVKGPDDTNAVKPFPHQVVLFIAKLIADFP